MSHGKFFCFYVFFAGLTILISSSFSATEITEGDITTDTEWDLAGHPYWVKTNVEIKGGATLTIEAGVVVKMAYTNALCIKVVNGSLELLGTETDPVYFTSERDDTLPLPYGEDTNGDGEATAPAAGDWGYLQYSAQSGSSILSNVEFRYGGNGPSAVDYLIFVHNADVNISDIKIVDAFELAIYYSSPSTAMSPSITGVEILNCETGIDFYPSSVIDSPLISDNTITATSCGISFRSSDSSLNGLISGNVITSPSGTGTGIIIRYSDSSTAVTDNTITDMVNGLHFLSASPTVSGNTISNLTEYPLMYQNSCSPVYSGNSFTNIGMPAIAVWGDIEESSTWIDVQGLGYPYHIIETLGIDNDTTLNIDPGIAVKFKPVSNNGMEIRGVLSSQPTGEPVIFTSMKDDTAGGDSNGDGSATVPSPGDWGYLWYQSQASGILHNAELRYGGNGYASVDYVIWVGGSDMDISDITITDCFSSGILYQSSSYAVTTPSITNVVIPSCETGIRFSHGSQDFSSEISDNQINASVCGILFNGSDAAFPTFTINANVIESSQGSGTGIHVIDCDATSSVSNNTISNMTNGLHFEDASPTVTGNSVTGAAEYPLIQQGSSFPVYSGNTFNNIGLEAIAVWGVIQTSGTWNDVQNLGYPYHVEETVEIDDGATLSIDPGMVVKFQTTGYPCFDIRGMLSLPSSGSRVVFTSMKDDTAGGDSNGDGSASVPSSGDWGYFHYYPQAVGNIVQNAEFRYGGNGKYSVDYVIWVAKASTEIRHNAFFNAYDTGIYYQASTTADSTALIHHNTIMNADTGIRFMGSADYNSTAQITYNYIDAGESSVAIELRKACAASDIGNNTIVNNFIGVDAVDPQGAFTVRENNIVGNSEYGVRCDGPVCILADDNWWGHETGPLDEEAGAGVCDNLHAGGGDEISEYVDYGDWSNNWIPNYLLNCSEAIQVTCGSTLNYQTTADMQSNIDYYGCDPSLYMGGNEKVYSTTTESSGSLQVVLWPDSETEPYVFILGSCNENACLASDERCAVLPDVPPGQYYIVIDSPSGHADFDIGIYCGLPTFTPTPAVTQTQSPTASPTEGTTTPTVPILTPTATESPTAAVVPAASCGTAILLLVLLSALISYRKMGTDQNGVSLLP